MNSLEDFERYIAEGKRNREKRKDRENRHHRDKDSKKYKKDKKEREHHHHHHHHHQDNALKEHQSKRLKPDEDIEKLYDKKNVGGVLESQKNISFHDERDPRSHLRTTLKRDGWMEAPLIIEVSATQKKRTRNNEALSEVPNHDLKIHKNELNTSLLNLVKPTIDDKIVINYSTRLQDESSNSEDVRSECCMTKLNPVYQQADGPIDNVIIETHDYLDKSNDVREKNIQLERRQELKDSYIGKYELAGEPFQRREKDDILNDISNVVPDQKNQPSPYISDKKISTGDLHSNLVDSTSLNRMKARLIKAKARKNADVEALENEYNKALANYEKNDSKPVVIELKHMENRMLAGVRNEVVPISSKRGQERGLVKENENMSIDDMIREERRTRGQSGGDMLRYAERIAKDFNFETNLRYLDENASNLAKRVHKSDVNLKNIAVNEYQKLRDRSDHCQLCNHKDRNPSIIAPVISLATRVYLTLPTEPELSEGGAVIVPLEHRKNLLECDNDEWEEIRNFMKSLTRMYHDQGRDVIFYENAAAPQRRHAAMQAVPIPYSLGEMAYAFFKEAILSSDKEWTQHKKLIDTAARSREGLGKQAFCRTIAKEMPYFHVWFDLNGGLGHIIEDSYRWPKGDLFPREVIGGMLNLELSIIRKQGRWHSNDVRTPNFRAKWRKFDWTRLLTED